MFTVTLIIGIEGICIEHKMSMSMMTTHGNGSWQTVKPKTEEKKKREDKKKKDEPVLRDRLGVPIENNVFAAIDSKWQATKKKQQVVEQIDEDTPYSGTFSGLDVEQSTVHDEPETPATPPGVDAQGSSISPPGSEQDHPVKKNKPKAPKKPKVTIQQVAQGVDVNAVRLHVAELQKRYPSEPHAQVMMLGDHLLKLFREVDLPFNNLLQEKPLYQAAEVPLNGVPADLTSVLSSFAGGLPQEVQARAVVELMGSIFEGLPDSFRSKAAQPPRAKVGLLVLLALLLRTSPQALLDAAPQLLAGGRAYTSGPRLLHLLWVIHQAALSNELVGLAVWTRVLLPQLLGVELAAAPSTSGKAATDAANSSVSGTLDAQSQEAAIDYAVALLATSGMQSRLGSDQPADLSSTEGPAAAIPSPSVESVARTCFVDGTGAGIRAQTRTRLATQVFPALAALAATSRVPQQHVAWVPLALETAANVSTSSFQGVEGDAVVERAACALLASLVRCDAAFGVWELKHKNSIKGSSRVLQLLAAPAAVQPVEVQRLLAVLLADGRKREQLHQLLGALQKRHQHYLQQGKGWQGAAARASETAVRKLESRTAAADRSSGSFLHTAALTVALTGSAAALVALAAHHREVVTPLVGRHFGPEAEQQASQYLTQLQALLEPYSGPIITAATPYVNQATTAAGPYVQQATAAVSPYLQQASAVVGPYLQQAGQAASEYGHKAAVAAAPALASAQQVAGQVYEQVREVAGPLVGKVQEALKQVSAGKQ